MNVQRICFLGTRTPNFDATSVLFRDVLGLRNVHTEIGWSMFFLRAPDGNVYAIQQDSRRDAT